MSWRNVYSRESVVKATVASILQNVLARSFQNLYRVAIKMPSRERPHPPAIFTLVPVNERAKAALQDPANAHLVSRVFPLPNKLAVSGFDVGLFFNWSASYTLATIGRTGDIVVSDPGISYVHCSFELHDGNRRGDAAAGPVDELHDAGLRCDGPTLRRRARAAARPRRRPYESRVRPRRFRVRHVHILPSSGTGGRCARPLVDLELRVENPQHARTTKMDVWTLFVTMGLRSGRGRGFGTSRWGRQKGG